MAPSHYLNQCWNIVNLNLRNKLQWNLKRNSYIFIQENTFENAVCEMAAILSRPQCVQQWRLSDTKYTSVNKAIFDFDNGLLPVWCQAIIWTNAGLSLLTGYLETGFSEIWIKIQQFSCKTIERKKMSVCIIVAILSQPPYVKHRKTIIWITGWR